MRKKRASEQTQPGRASLKTHEAHLWIRKWDQSVAGTMSQPVSGIAGWHVTLRLLPLVAPLPHSPPVPAPQRPPFLPQKKELQSNGADARGPFRQMHPEENPSSSCLVESLDLRAGI